MVACLLIGRCAGDVENTIVYKSSVDRVVSFEYEVPEETGHMQISDIQFTVEPTESGWSPETVRTAIHSKLFRYAQSAVFIADQDYDKDGDKTLCDALINFYMGFEKSVNSTGKFKLTIIHIQGDDFNTMRTSCSPQIQAK